MVYCKQLNKEYREKENYNDLFYVSNSNTCF